MNSTAKASREINKAVCVLLWAWGKSTNLSYYYTARVRLNRIYMRCIVYIWYFWLGITKYTVLYGVYIRFWSTLEKAYVGDIFVSVLTISQSPMGILYFWHGVTLRSPKRYCCAVSELACILSQISYKMLLCGL